MIAGRLKRGFEARNLRLVRREEARRANRAPRRRPQVAGGRRRLPATAAVDRPRTAPSCQHSDGCASQCLDEDEGSFWAWLRSGKSALPVPVSRCRQKPLWARLGGVLDEDDWAVGAVRARPVGGVVTSVRPSLTSTPGQGVGSLPHASRCVEENTAAMVPARQGTATAGQQWQTAHGGDSSSGFLRERVPRSTAITPCQDRLRRGSARPWVGRVHDKLSDGWNLRRIWLAII